MKMSEIARQAGVTPDAVRHYVDIGLLAPVRNPANGYQVFSAGDLSRLHFIRCARTLGFRLADIREIFEEAGKGRSPCPRVRELMAERITETRRQIDELSALCARMETAMSEWRNMHDSTPDGHSVCRLIESRFGADRDVIHEGSSASEVSR